MYFTWSNFIIGILGAALGLWVILQSFYLNHHVLFLSYFERKWGPGMGTTAYKLIGLLLMIFSMFVALGQINLFGSPYGQGPANSATRSQTEALPTGGNSIIAP
jgi:hypothetical protein